MLSVENVTIFCMEVGFLRLLLGSTLDSDSKEGTIHRFLINFIILMYRSGTKRRFFFFRLARRSR
jgi:hypothetical protein